MSKFRYFRALTHFLGKYFLDISLATIRVGQLVIIRSKNARHFISVFLKENFCIKNVSAVTPKRLPKKVIF